MTTKRFDCKRAPSKQESMSWMTSNTIGLGFESSNISLGKELMLIGYCLYDELGLNSGVFNAIPGASTIPAGDNKWNVQPTDESFEKQHYASGEMIISSAFVTLLIQEYAIPGLVAIACNIFGAGFGHHAKSKRSWIRSLSIPRE